MLAESIPAGYRHGPLALVPKGWVVQLLRSKALPVEWPMVTPTLSSADAQAWLRQRAVPDHQWALLHVQTYERRPGYEVLLAAELGREVGNASKSYQEVLADVFQLNQDAVAKSSRAKWTAESQNESSKKTECVLAHDEALLEVLLRLYGWDLLVVDASGENHVIRLPDRPMGCPSARQHLVAGAVAILINDDQVVLLRSLRRRKFSVRSALTLSPAFFATSESPSRAMLISYQLIRAFQSAREAGLLIGRVSLADATVDERLHVEVSPNVRDNLIDVAEPVRRKLPLQASQHVEELISKVRAALGGQRVDLDGSVLRDAVSYWSRGFLSNYDYLLLLNYLCGRTFSDPNHYPVLPWVSDFTSPHAGWRDLSKSKFRLNKGDAQLDNTYRGLQELADQREEELPLSSSVLTGAPPPQSPHHVSDVLSEITVYVYLARRTPRSVLCGRVRNRWVPAEYPSSMRRLQAWTPDECIPEFFSDPSIFTSVHGELARNQDEPARWKPLKFSTLPFLPCRRLARPGSAGMERFARVLRGLAPPSTGEPACVRPFTPVDW